MSATNLPPEVADLLAAIRDSLNVPLPASSGVEAYRALVLHRAGDVHYAVTSVLDGGDLPSRADMLRQWAEEHPVTYTPARTAQQDGAS